MRASKKGDRVRLALNIGEVTLLRGVLESLAAAYRTPPERLDSRVRSVWYSTRGCESAGMSDDESRDWVRQIHGSRGENLSFIEGWIDQLDETGASRATVEFPPEEAEVFVAVLNDHRLRAAAEHGIGQEEMDLRDPMGVASLGPKRRGALMEIHFLAWIIEVVLRLIAPDAAGWGAE